MRTALYRTEPGRFSVNAECRGQGILMRSGMRIDYVGVDVSRRGFGCIVRGFIDQGDSILLTIAGRQIGFQVMWTESHLGIENMNRAGLTPLDPEFNLELHLKDAGLIEVVTLRAS